MQARMVVILALGWCGVSGCGGSMVDPGEALDESNAEVVGTNGTSLNGTRLNGQRLNGTRLNGTRLNGAALNGTRLNGTRLNGTKLDGTVVDGLGFAGATLTGTNSAGADVSLRIDSISTSSSDADILYYRVSFYDTTTKTWKPICGVDSSGSSIRAIPVSGTWDSTGAKHADSNVFTFACKDVGAIAKCLELRYKPWKTHNGISLDAYHQACTRMMRADYCGDGRYHTRDGEQVNLYDKIGVQSDTKGWDLEAQWNANGATCISDAYTRGQAYTSNGATMLCANSKIKDDCNNRTYTGTLLFDEWN